ncbi:MAG: hypothetical protein LH480_15585, partial [Rubrivivax sp.]|nr:hypothetical protein [Rubrivivax sp.]
MNAVERKTGERRVPSMDIRADHRQTQTLSPRLQHAVRLLQMSSLDFAALVRDTLGKNPFLESEEGDGEGGDGDDGMPLQADHDQGGDGEPEARNAAELQATDTVDVSATDAFDRDYDSSSDRDLWQADSGSGLRRAEDGELSAM